MKITQFVRRAKNKLGFSSMEAFAEALNVSTRTVYRWYNGTCTPHAETILLIIGLCIKQGIAIDSLVFYWQ